MYYILIYICIGHIYVHTYMQHLDDVPVKNVDFRCHIFLSEGILAPLFLLAPSQWVALLELPETETFGGIPTPLKNISSSVGMMKFQTEWENKIHVPNHQPVSI